MSDQSTREQIRREAVERLARAEFEDDHRSEIAVFGWTWEGVAESMRDTYRLHAGRVVRALGDLLPTGGPAASVYVGTAPDGSPRAVFEDIADAQTWVAEMIAARGDYRYGYVTAPWTPRTEATK